MFNSLRTQASTKQKLISSIAHDFRGPLASISGYAETLREQKSLAQPEQEACLDAIMRNSGALDRIVDNSLVISKLEKIEKNLGFKTILIDDLFAALLERFQTNANEKGIVLTVHSALPRLAVVGDYALLERAFTNIIENSLQHTDPGKSVLVKAEVRGKRVRFSVADQGCGIAPQHLPHIFEEFYRVDKDRSRVSGGAGLGLAIVKQVLEIHGTAAEVQSRVGEGTTVCFELALSS
jgi:two-component system phosphate regulon sensor histidine kinase PhoR